MSLDKVKQVLKDFDAFRARNKHLGSYDSEVESSFMQVLRRARTGGYVNFNTWNFELYGSKMSNAACEIAALAGVGYDAVKATAVGDIKELDKLIDYY